MFRIIVLNPKGGCGKTTLSVNLAAYFSGQGYVTTLMDLDPQGSSVFWAHSRSEQKPPVQLVDAHNCSARMTRSWAIQPPRNTQFLIIDTPARPNLSTITPLLVDASAIVIPVQPSGMELHTASNFITQLIHTLPRQKNIAIAANRAKENTKSYRQLRDYFNAQQLPVVTTLRDTQNFANATDQGLGITEMKDRRCQQDKKSFLRLTKWCEEIKRQQDCGNHRVREAIPPDHFIALSGIA